MIATAEQHAPAAPPESGAPEIGAPEIGLPETGLSESRLGDAYRDFLRGLRMRQARIGYLLALGLVPAALSLDAFVYPELLKPILKSRVICDLALLPCFISLFRPFGLRHIHWLCNAWLVAPMLVICWMIYASEGSASPYYAGLNLVMLSACLLTTYNARAAIYFCTVVVAAYTISCWGHAVAPPANAQHKSILENGSLLCNNLYFLIATAVICIASCHFSARRRFEDFRLRHELDWNNRQLATTLGKLKATEVQLVQSEKMNALGKLSAGLLHEVNNPLNFTFMALQVAQREAGDNADLKETLADIEQGMSRIRGVIADLRAFAYPSRMDQAEPFRVAESVTTALRLTAHELGTIPVEQVEVEGATALGSKTLIVHVLMNLVVNSAHALLGRPPAGPGEEPRESPRITISCAEKDGRLEVAVRDNGAGVAPSDLPRLCEPFFTTKEKGKGTGLGLSICHTIVANHGGKLSITSEYGRWTRVAFDLPLAPPAATSPAATSPASGAEAKAEPKSEPARAA